MTDNTLNAEITRRVASASVAFTRLRKAKVWSSWASSLPTKLQFLQLNVMSVLWYGAETWTVMDKDCASLLVFLMNCLRRICGLSIMDCMPNVDILSMRDMFSMNSQLRSKRLRWFGPCLQNAAE